MVKLTIDNIEIEVPKGYTVLQAAQKAGIEIPIFCYHERLEVAGNCRMCLVEQEGAPKPIASCAMPATEGMVINTQSQKTIKARKGTLEFLLINHPLDCPICDQGGECDLQDITMAYGGGKSRYSENKRAVRDKEIGPIIKTSMNRCIHCTRCIRFLNDVAGVPEMGAIFRGENMEITTYLEQSVTSELSGNVIDLCPVGALTSKPYMFKGRPWDLKKTPSIDVMDATGCHIRVDSIGNKVVRILPQICEDINEEWISDKTRYACDGLHKQRLDRPFIKRGSKLVEATWDEALNVVAQKIRNLDKSKIAALAGPLSDVESMFMLKKLLGVLDVDNFDCRGKLIGFDNKVRASYTFNSGINGIDHSDFIFILGTNLRKDSPIINARIRKRYIEAGVSIHRLGDELDWPLTYPVNNIGSEITLLKEIYAGTHPIVKEWKKAKRPMMIIGAHVMERADSHQIAYLLHEIAIKYGVVTNEWNGYNILHKCASIVGGLDIGFIPNKGKNYTQIVNGVKNKTISMLYLMGEDNIDMHKIDPSVFVVYQGTHGDNGANRADVILPGLAYTEKNATYVNTEGRVQSTVKAINGPMVDFNIQAKEDWKIIYALAGKLDIDLSHDTLEKVRQGMQQVNKVFSQQYALPINKWASFGDEGGALKKDELITPEYNFYLENVVAKNSVTMALCAKENNSKAA